MQDPDGTAAFCHHHNIMTNVSSNSPKLEEKYRPSCKNELMLQINKISFAEDNLDSMTTKCRDCVIFVLCTKNYYWTYCPEPLIGRAMENALNNPPCPVIFFTTLTSSSVHHSSHQLTTTFLSYYDVT